MLFLIFRLLSFRSAQPVFISSARRAPRSGLSSCWVILKYYQSINQTGICVRNATSESKSTLIMTASPGDISVGLPPEGSQKEHAWFCRSTRSTWWSYFWCCNLSKCCRSVHFFRWNESEHVVLPIIIIWHSVRWISGALNEHYSKTSRCKEKWWSLKQGFPKQTAFSKLC